MPTKVADPDPELNPDPDGSVNVFRRWIRFRVPKIPCTNPDPIVKNTLKFFIK